MPTFEQIAEKLNLPATAGIWRENWEESLTLASNEDFSMLRPENFRPFCEELGFPPDKTEILLAGLALFDEFSELRTLLRYLYCQLYISPGALKAQVGSWPPLPESFLPRGALFPIYPALCGLPKVRSHYQQLGIPENIFIDTMSDFPVWMDTHRERHGNWGFSQLSWLIQHISFQLFKLGRLQFQFGTYHSESTSIRKEQTGDIVVLAPNRCGVVDGRFAESEDREEAWETVFVESATSFRGHRICADGRIQQEPETFPKKEWKVILRKGDAVLNIHIPAGEPLFPDACQESFRQAFSFFPRYFPDFDFKALVCTSWLLDPQLGQQLKPQSNLASLQRQLRLQPAGNPSHTQILERVFGKNDPDLDTAPRDNSLRRTVLDHLAKGKRWRSASCIVFPQDLKK